MFVCNGSVPFFLNRPVCLLWSNICNVKNVDTDPELIFLLFLQGLNEWIVRQCL